MIKTIKNKLYQEYVWKAVHLIITMYLLYNLESMTWQEEINRGRNNDRGILQEKSVDLFG